MALSRQDSLITNSSLILNSTYLNVAACNINNLDGIQNFTSLTSLFCATNYLTSLPTLPPGLVYLDCAFNQLTSLPPLPNSLNSLWCQFNELVSLPTLPSTLTLLWCHNNHLTSLPLLPNSIANLDCYNNQITLLPNLPLSLTDLFCNSNLLTMLPSLPSSLYSLNCSDNQLTNLPALPNSLVKLWCNLNTLTNLPTLPNSLNDLYCGFNQLSSLPVLPNSLNKLYCSYNTLLSLPSLPGSLTELYCAKTQLTSLPALPDSLILLYCLGNQLTTLPVLPNSLHGLYCSNNQLAILPELPINLTELRCDTNQLTTLPLIPGSVHILNCKNNPISCFPNIAPHVIGSYPGDELNTEITFITCIPNQTSSPLSVVHSSQPLPLCSPANNTCYYNFTSGYVYLDTNGNGIKDSLENGIPIPVYYSGNYGSWPDSSGFFNATSDTGNIIFQVNVPTYYISTTAASQAIHVASGIVDTLYFGLQPIPNIKDLKVDLTSIGFLRPGFKAKYKLHYQNVGTDTLYNVQLKFLKPTQLTNLSATPAASLVSSDTLIWHIPSLIPYQQGDVIIIDSVFANAILGDTAKAFAWIAPWVGDTTPLNNSAISTNIIRGAYDPNDKSVSINRVLPNSTDNLEYTIRFQNTGTDTAYTVTVMDKLSALLDISSMQMIGASHNYELSIVNGFAKWIFKNILLPDSNTNELESHGFVKFSIKPKPGLTLTDSIQNKADIYFDYNAAVTTNTIVVNVLNPLQVKDFKETELQIYPNPVQESLRIVNQHAGALGKIELINASGKVLETKTISSSTYIWNLQHLPAGTYILKGQGWGQKVVKE
ncbi:MAG: DUF11 domain-containing protein [Bacteroidetes bacterium]|nr:DUF11 domain-containing protein [Bacteroidota bacterium]